MNIHELQTPALLIDAARMRHNLSEMSARLPGNRLRPHVKTHKCTALAQRQAEAGHRTFTCATTKEVAGMAAAGLGEDLLLANEVLDTRRLRNVEARITMAVDSELTVEAAAKAGIGEVVVDVAVGLRRGGCAPEDAGRIADLARSAKLEVRGVMGYEGHAVGIEDRQRRIDLTARSMELLLRGHKDVGGELISAGGTGTYDINTWASEIQAGSYVLMDASYGRLGLPFLQALYVLATVTSVSRDFAVADAGLKAFGMNRGNPIIEDAHKVEGLSDEHVTFAPFSPVSVGDRIRLIPGHIDPTIAYHENMYLVENDEVIDVLEVDLRGW